jgi:tetratricopeptide (TPR) repeat protein
LHHRAGRHPQTIALMRKLLAAEPDNLRIQLRVAELSLAAGEKQDAAAALRAAAELLHLRGDNAEGIKHLDRALEAVPGDAGAALLKAKLFVASDKRSDAIALLESSQELQEGEAGDLLISLLMEEGHVDRASMTAANILTRNRRIFGPAAQLAATLLETAEANRTLPLLDLIRDPMIEAGEHEHVSTLLRRAVELLPDAIEPRKWLVICTARRAIRSGSATL